MLCAGGAFSIAQLTASTDITRQAVSKHLQVLADAGLVIGLLGSRPGAVVMQTLVNP